MEIIAYNVMKMLAKKGSALYHVRARIKSAHLQTQKTRTSDFQTSEHAVVDADCPTNMYNKSPRIFYSYSMFEELKA